MVMLAFWYLMMQSVFYLVQSQLLLSVKSVELHVDEIADKVTNVISRPCRYVVSIKLPIDFKGEISISANTTN